MKTLSDAIQIDSESEQDADEGEYLSRNIGQSSLNRYAPTNTTREVRNASPTTPVHFPPLPTFQHSPQGPSALSDEEMPTIRSPESPPHRSVALKISEKEQRKAVAEAKRVQKDLQREERAAAKQTKDIARVRQAFSKAEERGTFRLHQVEIVVSPQLFNTTTRKDVLSHVHQTSNPKTQDLLTRRQGDRIFYAIYGIEAECKRRRNLAARQGSKAPVVTLQAVQDSYTALYMDYGIQTQAFVNASDAGKYILELTNAIADKPYYHQDDFLDASLAYRDARKKLSNRSTVISMQEVTASQGSNLTRQTGSDDEQYGQNQDVARGEEDTTFFVPIMRSEGSLDLGYMYLAFLALVPRMSFEKAISMRRTYPTFSHLQKAFSRCSTLEEQHTLFANLSNVAATACSIFYLRAIAQKIHSHSAFIAYAPPLVIHMLLYSALWLKKVSETPILKSTSGRSKDLKIGPALFISAADLQSKEPTIIFPNPTGRMNEYYVDLLEEMENS